MGFLKLICTISFFLFSILFYLFIFSILFFSYGVYIYATIEACSPIFIPHNEWTIRFPFRLTNQQPDSCGYPGFELSCDSANKTILKLPYSGEFSVQAINYVKKELRLKDPNNCLPQKLLSLNLSGSPFMGKYYQNVSFYNCSLDHVTYGIKPISCLTGSDDQNIYATSYMHAFTFMSSNCTLVKEISIPMQLPNYYGGILSRELNKDLRLTWTAPYCEGCERRSGQCRKTACSHISGTSWVGCSLFLVLFWLPIFFVYGVLALCHVFSCGLMGNCVRGFVELVCFLYSWVKDVCVGAVCFIFNLVKDICGRVRRFCFIWVKDICGGVFGALFSWVKNICGRCEPLVELTPSTIAPPSTTITHLNGLTLESYPKIVLGESLRLPKPDDDICSICISEYKPKETLKTIPKCNHCFHADCIDEWLRLNPTCPICRNSP